MLLALMLPSAWRVPVTVTVSLSCRSEACPTTVVLSHGALRYAGLTAGAFADRSMVEEAGIEPPHLTTLSRSLGLPDSVNEAGFLAALKH